MAVTLSMMACSCSSTSENEDNKTFVNDEKNYIKVVHFENHSYVTIYNAKGENRSLITAVTHNPNCGCSANSTTEEEW